MTVTKAEQYSPPGFRTSDNTCGAKLRVAFLFNHDAAHQAAHIAGIAQQMALTCPDIEVIAAYGTPAIRSFIETLLSAQAISAIHWIELAIPATVNRLLGPLDAIAPARRLARLHYNLQLFVGFDMVVSTERTCLRVKRKLRGRSPVFAYVPHGSGDRNVAYHPELTQFDLYLLSGQKLINEIARHGIACAEQCRLIGYPKFDLIDRNSRQRFFRNDKPVFLYNPHFDPLLSSWYDEGLAILEYFRANANRFNLIFAPHVMLFRKKLHYSLEYRTARFRPDIPAIYRDCPNILIDTDSHRLFDMSYTLSADAYIGDMGSQVYEFLFHPRACYFVDVHSNARVGDPPPYEFWRNGPVCKSGAELLPLLPRWQEIAGSYRAEQQRLFAYTIDDDAETPATLRGARAVAEFIRARPSSRTAEST